MTKCVLTVTLNPAVDKIICADHFIDLSTTKSKEVVNTAFSSREERSNTSQPSVFGKEKASKSSPPHITQ